MPKINPDDYYDGTDYCDPDDYDLDYVEDGHYPIAHLNWKYGNN